MGRAREAVGRTDGAQRWGRRKRGRLVLGAAAAVLLAAGLSGCHVPPWQNQLVSVNAVGSSSGNDESHGPALSADGTRVVFSSSASDLGPTDTNGLEDIYVRDLTTGVTSLVTVNTVGTDGANDDSLFQALSRDGTKVGFSSHATNLATPASDGRHYDVFVRDLTTGTTTLASVNVAGTGGGNEQSDILSFSPDGNRVLFVSRATNLVPGGTAGLYERDLTTGVTTRLADGWWGAYSPSGDAVAFFQNNDLYLREASTGTIRLLVGSPAGSGRLTGAPVFSHDGTRIAFQREFDPSHVKTDIYVYDRVAKTTTLVTVDIGGSGGSNNTPSTIHGFHPTDANRLLFSSFASNLVANDTNAVQDLFVRDLGRRTTSRVVSGVGSGSGRHASLRMASWLGNGSKIAFVSFDNSYGVTDTNLASDVYVLDVAARTYTLVSAKAGGHDSGSGDSGRYLFLGGFSLWGLSASSDGTRIAFDSYANDLGPTDSDRQRDPDIYVASLVTASP